MTMKLLKRELNQIRHRTADYQVWELARIGDNVCVRVQNQIYAQVRDQIYYMYRKKENEIR